MEKGKILFYKLNLSWHFFVLYVVCILSKPYYLNSLRKNSPHLLVFTPILYLYLMFSLFAHFPIWLHWSNSLGFNFRCYFLMEVSLDFHPSNVWANMHTCVHTQSSSCSYMLQSWHVCHDFLSIFFF